MKTEIVVIPNNGRLMFIAAPAPGTTSAEVSEMATTLRDCSAAYGFDWMIIPNAGVKYLGGSMRIEDRAELVRIGDLMSEVIKEAKP